MELRIISRYLGIIVLLLGLSMLLSVPWAFPALGEASHIEETGLIALLGSMLISVVFGGTMLFFGWTGTEELLRKETMAIVGLSWIAATILGALPLLLSGSCGNPWEFATVVDAVFESASGFTGTGSTIYQDLENASVLPRCILFWRQETHFLGGLGIMVLFVALLGHGAPGKMLMRAEAGGPLQQSAYSKMRHAAWAFAFIYLAMNAVLTVLYLIQGMSPYDALSHSFATVATGGFSTYNSSLAHFDHVGIETTTTFFMVLACTNFLLLFALIQGRPLELLTDPEFRTYLTILALSTLIVMLFGLEHKDFDGVGEAVRYASFQVVSIQTNTGLATADFDRWDETARCLLFGLMFVGGCAGSTSCSIKVIRYVLLAGIFRFEIERSFRPNLVRPLRYAGKPVDSEAVERGVPFYFALFAVICVLGWLTLLLTEPDELWRSSEHFEGQKAIDCASAVAACINGVGPGFGIVGPTQNFAVFSNAGKLVLVFLMLLGRLELFAILCLITPSFWRRF